MNETEKTSAIVYKSLLDDMRLSQDATNQKAVGIAFDDDDTWEGCLDERELKECEFAKHYAVEFAHGTAGHNRLMLIAKLCEILDVYEEALDRMISMADEGRSS